MPPVRGAERGEGRKGVGGGDGEEEDREGARGGEGQRRVSYVVRTAQRAVPQLTGSNIHA
jgi:hypothetical protein